MALMLRYALIPTALLCACALAHAEDAPAKLPPPQPGWTVIEDDPPPGKRPDAKIEHIVVEDNNARVEELRERGEVRKVKVHPKLIPAPDYEITVGDASVEPFRDIYSSPRGAARAVGSTVWSVLDF